MDAATFIRKWSKSNLSERSAAQSHFNDLCELLGHPTPAEMDPAGEFFTFEKGAAKRGGGEGWADVWKRGFFGWEYKGRDRNLEAAYQQLLQYSEALENPPLLVVCDMNTFVVHTHFNATANRVYQFPLDELSWPSNLEILRAVFFEPEKLRPGTISAVVTSEAAGRIAEVAGAMRDRGLDPHDVAHFLDRVVFCLFAEDVGLLPNQVMTRLFNRRRTDPARVSRVLGNLFAVMAGGGDFGVDEIIHFNGNMFNGGAFQVLTVEEIERLRVAARLDWAVVDASIFGTLFERGMDPARRAQLGAHYTSREDIETLVEPVVMAPLRREWAEARQAVENLLATGGKLGQPAETGSIAYDYEQRDSGPTQVHEEPARYPSRGNARPVFGAPAPKERKTKENGKKARLEADLILHRFSERLARVTVLDPACGSGNFLYVTLQKLKDLEKEVIAFAAEHGFGGFFPLVGPWQLYGLEINEYARDLAQMTVWIGYLQWMRRNGFQLNDDPLLRRMNNYRCADAILDLSDPDNPKEPEWPAVDFIVGNPPFLGGKMMRRELGDEYVEKLFQLWKSEVRPEADLCCYWFEKARRQIERGKCRRAGLLATQGIRGGANREVLKRIKDTGDIFFAESDRPWILDGSNVHVSMVGFDDGVEKVRSLDGRKVDNINANLTSSIDITSAIQLKSNRSIAFMGITPSGPFIITDEEAIDLLSLPNPHEKPNSNVLRPWVNGSDITSRASEDWIIDFEESRNEAEAVLFEQPFTLVTQRVQTARERYKTGGKHFWRFERGRPEMRNAFSQLDRYIARSMVGKHHFFIWLPSVCLPANLAIVFARSDDYFFGVLHSRPHEVWARALGTQLRERESGFRYTPTTCFETFTFPRPTEGQAAAIAAAARELDRLRNAWLNPPEWTREEVLEFPGTAGGPWARYLHDADSRGIGTVRYPRLAPRDAGCAARLKERTLTNLYNARPAWLAHAHHVLDEAVFAAYGWEAGISDEEVLERLLELNQITHTSSTTVNHKENGQHGSTA